MIRIPINRIENTNKDLTDVSCSQCNFLLFDTFIQCTRCNIKYCEECNSKIREENKSCIKCGAENDLMKEGTNYLELDQLKVKCVNYINGCNLVFSCNNLIGLNKHQAKCEYKMIKCGICQTVEFVQKDSKIHEDLCPKVIISCNNCKSKFERQNLEKHNNFECFYILSSCRFCEKKIPFISMKEHIIRCKPIRVKCKICGFDKLKNHECIFGLINKINKFQKENETWMKVQKEDQENIIETLEKIQTQVLGLKTDYNQNENANTMEIKNSIKELLTKIIQIYVEQEKRNKEDTSKIFNSYGDLKNDLDNSDLKIQGLLKDLIANLNLVFKTHEENKKEIKTIISNIMSTEISSKLDNLNNEILENRNSISKITLNHKNEISNLITVEIKSTLNNLNLELKKSTNCLSEIPSILKTDISQMIFSEISSKFNNLDKEVKESKNTIINISSTLKNEFKIIKKLIRDQGLISEQKFQEVNTNNDYLRNEIIKLNENFSKDIIFNKKNETESLKKQVENQIKEFNEVIKKTEDQFIKIQKGITEINCNSNNMKKELNDERKKRELEINQIQNEIANFNKEANFIRNQTTNINSAFSLLSDEILTNFIVQVGEINQNCKSKFDEIYFIELLTLLRIEESLKNSRSIQTNIELLLNNQWLYNNVGFQENPLNFSNESYNHNTIQNIDHFENSFSSIKTKYYEKIKNLNLKIISNFVGSKIETNQNSELAIIENELIPQVTSKLKDISSLSLKVCKNPKNISFSNTKSDFINYLNNWNREFACNYIFTEEIYNTKEQIEKNQYLYYVGFDQNSKKLILHIKNLKSLSIIQKELYKQNSAYEYVDGIFHKSKFFCCGGRFNEEYLNICSIFNLENQTLDNSIKLNEQKSMVSLVSTSKFIWCLGGMGNIQSTNNCEFFDNISNLWKIGPPLNNFPINISSFFFDPQEIYVLGSAYMKDFQKLNITSLSNKWEIIKISPYIVRNYGCTIQINNFELLLFCGFNLLNEIYIFNTKNFSLIPLSKEFSKNTIISNSTRPIYFNHSIYLIVKEEKKVLQMDPITLDCKESTLDF